ncbi:endolytic transglycosylase MltG [Aquibacillus sediminis]|uniref:endolytic transglycosylase MltG n=1 Tax=Aquibacillus sediminis TaxID=2574734 RepID=UPI001FEC3BD0|nr:endolytic transglycosylase MltG [Aquibacillus sediminis]
MKQLLRAFALGLFSATIPLALTYIYIEKPMDQSIPEDVEQTEPSIDEMIQSLEQEGYYIYTDEHPMQEDEQSTGDDSNVDTDRNEATEENPEDTNTAFLLVIEQGTSVSSITDQLYEAGIIESKQEFSTFLDEQDYSTKIQIGEFELTPSMSYKQIANTITTNN